MISQTYTGTILKHYMSPLHPNDFNFMHYKMAATRTYAGTTT